MTPTVEAGVAEAYVDLRPLLFSIAYRMLGSASDAEDVVQLAYLRYFGYVDRGNVVESAKALLTTITTRLSSPNRPTPCRCRSSPCSNG